MSEIHLYEGIDRAYFAASLGKGVHFLSAFLERQVRFVACLGASAAWDDVERAGRMPRSTGLGGYLDYLQSAIAGLAVEARFSDISAMYESILDSLDSDAPSSLDSLKKYRDFLAHGGLEPEGKELHSALERAKDLNAKAITKFISGRGGIHLIDDRLVLGSGESLHPLIIQHRETFAIYQCMRSAEVSYNTLSRAMPELKIVANQGDLYQSLIKIVNSPSGEQNFREVSDFSRALRRDLEGYREYRSSFEVVGRYSPFEVKWVWKTSAGPEARIDRFRIGSNYARQWFDGEVWESYDVFLLSISNWKVVVKRLCEQLEEQEPIVLPASVSEDEASMIIPESIVTRYVNVEDIGSSFGESHSNENNELEKLVDASAQSLTGVPQVFFITGEAGVGKTHNLFTKSKQRALDLAQDPQLGLPFYLYISCSGVGLKKIPELLRSAVNNTRNLDDKSVLSLCRNGLMVLVIDGFDELLGGAGYSDAFQLLSPILGELGGRGTLVLSARSSYFANQYRSSVNTALATGDIPAHHRILELQRWSKVDVEAMFQANPSWGRYGDLLGDQDRALLGVPFFSHVFHSYAADANEENIFSGLRSVLIDSYLDRETIKLQSAGGGGEVSRNQLRSIFRDLAGMLHDDGSSTLDSDDFKFVCASALGLEAFSGRYKALGDRLLVLCGISTAISETGGILFSFEHELFYEVLLAEYLSDTYLRSSGANGAFVGLLQRSVLGDSTLQSLVERNADEIAAALPNAMSLIYDQSSILASNVSGLVSKLIQAMGSVPANYLSSIRLSELEIATPIPGGVKIENCEIDHLRVSVNSGSVLSVRNSKVGRLEVQAVSQDRKFDLELDDQSRINELHIQWINGGAAKFFTGGLEILRALQNLGVQGLQERIAEAEQRDPSEFELFCVDVLEKMSARNENSYVIDSRTKVPGDGASAWMPRPTNGHWAELTELLRSNDLAGIKGITASGASKSVVTFKVLSERVARSDHSVAGIASFWAEVRSGR